MTSPPLNANRLLATLPAGECERLALHSKVVSLDLGQILFRPDEEIRHAYFPTTCVISLLVALEDGAGMEVGLVGKEGIVGISAILGGEETKLATVQRAGMAVKVSVEVFREEFRRSSALQVALLRYTHALMTHISQSVVCNMRHKVEERLARWLLMFRDRAESDEFELTHEFMANMLGVRRSSISEIASKLQRRRLIHYQRGHIRILDGEGLEAFACECYSVVKEKYDAFLR